MNLLAMLGWDKNPPPQALQPVATATERPPLPDLTAYGIDTDASLRARAGQGPSWVVHDLFARQSVNLFVGDSGLGKTPLLVHLGLCVATGLPWMTFPTTKGRVLYFDAETSEPNFDGYLTTLKRFLGITDNVPDFAIVSVNFGPPRDPSQSTEGWMETKIKLVEPDLVIIDCLRPFWPGAETKSDEAAHLFKWQREMAARYGCAFITVHHRRKHGQGKERPVALTKDPSLWLQETAGSYALINQADVRLGIERPDAENEPNHLVFAGFSKFRGEVRPYNFMRIVDTSGDPIGYEGLVGKEFLSSDEFREAYDALPEEFGFADIFQALGGKSNSKADRFRKEIINLRLVRSVGAGRNKRYFKTEPPLGGTQLVRDLNDNDPDSPLIRLSEAA